MASDACFITRDADGQALAYVYFEEEPGRRTAAKLLTKDKARRMGVNRIVASSPCWMDIRRRLPGWARSRATMYARSASNISARPDLLADLYRHYGIDANAIVAAAQAIAPGRPIRHLKALP